MLDHSGQSFLIGEQKQTQDKRTACGDRVEAECKPLTEAPLQGELRDLAGEEDTY